mgnify:CR=1 FL=1
MKALNTDIHLFNGNALDYYRLWESPTVIVSDGPYGVKGFPGDLRSETGLAEWYEPHIKSWSEKSSPRTTLWFWCTEQGWATVHPVLLEHGWEFKCCNIWNKGMGHVAGNVNTKTISRLPVVTEVCVQYVKKPVFSIDGKPATMGDWLIHEWKRTGLPFRETNVACGVIDAATRKYFTKDDCLWYMPPSDKFEKIVHYANTYGNQDNKPFFTIDGKSSLTKEEWETYRPIFRCPMGITNVWEAPQLRNHERLKDKTGKSIHLNQKPLAFIQNTIEWTSDPGDVVWDPFGGLFTTAIACLRTGRKCFSAEISEPVYIIGEKRVKDEESSSNK